MDSLEQIGLGQLKLSIKDFRRLTLRELFNAIEGHRQEKDNDLQWSLHNARFIAFHAMDPMVRKKNQIRKPQDLFHLPIDKELKQAKIKKMKPIKKLERK